MLKRTTSNYNVFKHCQWSIVRNATTRIVNAQALLQRVRRIQVIEPIDESERGEVIEGCSSGLASVTSLTPAVILGEPTKAVSSKILLQYRELKGEYPRYMILMQVGDFFEIFDEDAERASRLLDIGLCNNRYGTLMTGFPLRAMDSYLERLVKAGVHSVIVEQVEMGKVIKRQATRVVTPGTLTEDALLESGVNNFMLAIDASEQGYALAWIDLSTGCFRVLEIDRDDLSSELQRINPTELIVSDHLKVDKMIVKFMRSNRTTFADLRNNSSMEIDSDLMDDFFGNDLEASCLSPSEASVASRLLQYVLDTQIGKRPFIKVPQRFIKRSMMRLDPSALRSLEILKNNSTNSKENSLLGVLDNASTAAGSRLLMQMLAAPLLDVEEINHRLDQVEAFTESLELAEVLVQTLRDCRDIERSFQRLALGRSSGGPRDMLVIKQTLLASSLLKKMLINHGGGDETFRLFAESIDSCREITDCLSRALVDTPPSRVTDGGLIRRGYSTVLDELIGESDTLKVKRDALLDLYRRTTRKSRLKLSTRKTLGLLAEVSKSEGPIDDPKFILESVIGDKYRYRTTELEALNTSFNDRGEEALREEVRIYEGLRQQIVAAGKRIMKTARVIAELDVFTACALQAVQRGYTRPILTNSQEFYIEKGRHPVVEERHLEGGRTFVRNCCELSDRNHFALITGPNMGGKSTFLRQNAIIPIMAQCGMFVPADKAVIGLIDAVYTRIGASDDLARDRSTFMVEMSETASILRHATPQSLVIMDEIGRGTGAAEGFALARGICEFLYSRGCRTLFATHF